MTQTSRAMHLTAKPYRTLDFRRDELGVDETELQQLPWAKAGVAQIRSGRLGISLQVGPFVGRITIPGRFVIDLLELVPGTLEAMAPLALQGRRWIAATGQTGTVAVEPWVVIAELFTAGLKAYVDGGVDRRYMPRQYDTNHPRGTLNVRRSVSRFWSRDRWDWVSSDVRWLTEDTAVNRLMISAAVRAEYLMDARPTQLMPLRTAIRALAGVRVLVSPDVHAARATSDPVDRDLVELAVLLVHGMTGLPVGEVAPAQPVDVWFDVSQVFEGAVRHLVADLLPPGTVRAGKGDGVQLFSDNGRTRDYPADPDVVVTVGDGVVAAVLDAKYREHGAKVERDEIYQLMAHAAAYGARSAALVVPQVSAEDRSFALGTDRYGRHYDVLVVDATDSFRARAELERWLESRGLPILSAADAPAQLPAPA